MYPQPITLDTLHLPSKNAVSVNVDSCINSEGSYTSAVDSSLTIHPLFSHPEHHLLLNEISLTNDDFHNVLRYPTNFNVAPVTEYTDGWMPLSMNGQDLEAPGSSNLSLSSSIPFPTSAWASSDIISDPSPAGIYNTMNTNESESLGCDGINATQESLSFWIIDSEAGTTHYQCECGKITKNKGDMRRHRQSLKHSGRSHTCPCGGSYTRKDSFKRHAQMCSYAAGISGNLCNA